MLEMVGVSLALVTASAGAPGPCDFLTRDAASQLLGQPVGTPTPSGPEPDEDTGGTRTVCVYQAGKRMLILIRVAFATSQAAREATTQELVGERYGEGEDDFTIKEEAGLGDRAFSAHSSRAAEFIVVKGASVLGLTLGGMPEAPSAYQAQLRAAAALALKKFP